MHAVITLVPEAHVLGQSIGFIVPLKGTVPLLSLGALCEKLGNGSFHEQVDINFIGAHTNLTGACLGVIFHFPITQTFVPDEVLPAVREWIEGEFGVADFEEKRFPTRLEFCAYMRGALTVM